MFVAQAWKPTSLTVPAMDSMYITVAIQRMLESDVNVWLSLCSACKLFHCKQLKLISSELNASSITRTYNTFVLLVKSRCYSNMHAMYYCFVLLVYCLN